MTSDCTDVASYIEQRLVTLSARIYSHQNLIAQYIQEKERLECLLANLPTDAEDGEGDGGGDAPVETVSQPIYVTTSTSMENNGPWQ